MKILQILVVIFAFSVFCDAQDKSKLCGTVRDEFGAIVPNVTIEAKLKKGNTFKTKTDESGNFEMEIPDGLYKILIKAESFKKVVMKNQLLPFKTKNCMEIVLASAIPPHQIT